jgi:hypothetical protein
VITSVRSPILRLLGAFVVGFILLPLRAPAFGLLFFFVPFFFVTVCLSVAL